MQQAHVSHTSASGRSYRTADISLTPGTQAAYSADYPARRLRNRHVSALYPQILKPCPAMRKLYRLMPTAYPTLRKAYPTMPTAYSTTRKAYPASLKPYSTMRKAYPMILKPYPTMWKC